MKYIVTKQKDTGIEEIFLFNDSINHDAFVESIVGIRSQTTGNWERIYRLPIAAGFFDGLKCFGRSETLDLDSRKKKDLELIN